MAKARLPHPRPSSPTASADRPVPTAFDIVIVGGGMAAVMAALAAKTEGNRVLIIEPSNVLGGQGTAGGVAGFCGDSARVNCEFAELIARLQRHELIEPYRPNDDRRAYDLEWCAFFLQEMVVRRGIDVLLHARVVGAQADAGVVHELRVSTSGGMLLLHPRFVIDASGACVVPLLTGFPVLHEGSNRQLPMSLYFTLWDTGRAVTPILPEGCPAWTHDDEIPMTSLHRFPTGKVEVKMKVVGFDAADGMGRSAAEIFARRQMHGLIYYLQTVGYKGRKLDTHVLASVSRGIGIREERRIVGEHVLTEDEARRAVIFPDAVAVNTYHIDYHWPDRMERAGTGITDMLDPHHLPLRMMIPRGARNLLVPGRGASGDQTAMSAYRVMAVVAQMGYAAGHAARQCVECGTDITTIDLPRLQAAIRAGGQSLDLSDYGEYLRNDLFTEETFQPAPWPGAPATAPALVQLSNGRFLAAWVVGHHLWLVERREKSWQAPYRASCPLPRDLQAMCMERDSNHRLLLRLERIGGATGVFESLDEGATWRGVSDTGGLRPAAARLVAGTWIALEVDRASDIPKICVRQSFDGGVTWPSGRSLRLDPADLSADFAILDNGDLALAFRGRDEDGRASLGVALSRDQGRTWYAQRSIDGTDRAGRSPAIVPTRTGFAVLAVSGERFMFWHGASDRIVEGPPKASAHALQA